MVTEFLRRKRLFWWLVRAYIRRRKQTILTFFLAGLAFGILIFFLFPKLAPLLPRKTETIGIVGSYTIETLPIELQNSISLGLTRTLETGEASPSAASSFEISEDGKTYRFLLRRNLVWQDGKAFSAFDINYNFKDVQIEAKTDFEVVFTLKEPFAPFPTVLSQPLFRKGLVGLSSRSDNLGLSEYKVADIALNGAFVDKIVLDGYTKSNRNRRKVYKFYPSEEVAKTAFMLGEIDSLTGLLDMSDFINWKNVRITKRVQSDQLVTIFYNTAFPLLADKAVRQALTYALPDEFDDNTPASTPLSYKSWAYSEQPKFSQNLEAANKLFSESKTATQGAEFTVTLTTTPKFARLADQIKEVWGQLGISTNINVVTIIPSDPQVLLERFRIPQDPDQYILWHSTQSTNISRFSSPKIDKMLEDGRQTVSQDERTQIYGEFQRHIVEEAPAAFLYYPTVYTISRK